MKATNVMSPEFAAAHRIIVIGTRRYQCHMPTASVMALVMSGRKGTGYVVRGRRLGADSAQARAALQQARDTAKEAAEYFQRHGRPANSYFWGAA